MQTTDTAELSEQGESSADDALQFTRAALNDAVWRGHGGFEIAASPVIIGLFGWFVDGRIGTTPLFTIIGVLFGLFGSIANQYYRYTARMDELEAERLAVKASNAGGTERPRFARTATDDTEPDSLLDIIGSDVADVADGARS